MDNALAHIMYAWQPRTPRRTKYIHVDNYLATLGRLFDEKEVRKDLDYKG